MRLDNHNLSPMVSSCALGTLCIVFDRHIVSPEEISLRTIIFGPKCDGINTHVRIISDGG